MKKFNECLIEKKLNSYIWNNLFIKSGEKKFLSNLLSFTDVIVFGGVVREYVLNNFNEAKHRDVDLVVTTIDDDVEEILHKHLTKINSFGGYKLKVGRNIVDLWMYKETWAVKKINQPLFESVTDFLPHTSFFNINAVAFSIKNQKLIYSDSFKEFLENRILDIEFLQNPLPALCLIKTYEYFEIYKIKLSPKLINFIQCNYEEYKDDFYNMQVKHYGYVKYPSSELNNFFEKIISKSEVKPPTFSQLLYQ